MEVRGKNVHGHKWHISQKRIQACIKDVQGIIPEGEYLLRWEIRIDHGGDPRFVAIIREPHNNRKEYTLPI